MEIFEKLSLIILPILVATFFASLIPRKFNERQKFIEAVTEFRKTFNQALVDIQSSRFGIINDDIIKNCRVAYLNFRPYLHGKYHRQYYDETWDRYCRNFPSADTEKAVESLLKFTEYRVFCNIPFFLKRLWLRLRLKVLGPDKETKELIEKFYHNELSKK